MAETDTKERIKNQAHELIMQYGIRSVSMDDIANSLGISKKTIYQFYADKNELVKSVVENMLQRNELICERDAFAAENAVHEIFMAIELMGEMMQSMNPSLVFDLHKYHPDAFQLFHKYKSEFLFNVIRENLIRGIREDLYRTDLNVDMIARFRVESVMIPFNPEFQSKTRLTLSKMQEELIELYLFGVANLKGHKLIQKYKQQYQNKA